MPFLHLTLTSVVFELQQIFIKTMFMNLTLTSVVFEFINSNINIS